MLKDKVREFRKESNLTQQQLAEKLNMKRTAITEIESGRVKGTLEFINKISELSGKPISYWADSEVEKNYKAYEALDILIDAMIDSGMIKEDGKIGENETKLIISVLEKEVAYKIKKRAN